MTPEFEREMQAWFDNFERWERDGHGAVWRNIAITMCQTFGTYQHWGLQKLQDFLRGKSQLPKEEKPKKAVRQAIRPPQSEPDNADCLGCLGLNNFTNTTQVRKYFSNNPGQMRSYLKAANVEIPARLQDLEKLAEKILDHIRNSGHAAS